MIRSKEPQTQLFYSSEEIKRSPRVRFYQRLNAAVGSWKELCEPLRGAFSDRRTGRPVDPVVYFKIFLIGYLEGIVWDTDLAERIADSLSIREFIGYGLTESLPDHSSISRVRAAFAKEDRLERVLEKTVALCERVGLVSGEEVSVDSTLMGANASLSSLQSVKSSLSVKEHLRQARENGEKLKVSNEEFRSASDPDARIAKKGPIAPRGMYYKSTLVVDSKAQVILAQKTSHADEGDASLAREPLRQAKEALEGSERSLGTVVADSAYDDSEFHAFVEEELEASPLTMYKAEPEPKEGRFVKADFVYEGERDAYRCPAGKTLSAGGSSAGRIIYSAKTSDCKGCPLKPRCLSKKAKRRTLHRTRSEAARERNIARCHTEKGRSALKRRRTVAEPPFAHMKRLGALRTLNCRGLGKAGVKTGVACVAWNLLKLAKNLSEEALERLNRRFSSFLPHFYGSKRALRPTRRPLAEPRVTYTFA